MAGAGEGGGEITKEMRRHFKFYGNDIRNMDELLRKCRELAERVGRAGALREEFESLAKIPRSPWTDKRRDEIAREMQDLDKSGRGFGKAWESFVSDLQGGAFVPAAQRYCKE